MIQSQMYKKLIMNYFVHVCNSGHDLWYCFLIFSFTCHLACHYKLSLFCKLSISSYWDLSSLKIRSLNGKTFHWNHLRVKVSKCLEAKCDLVGGLWTFAFYPKPPSKKVVISVISIVLVTFLSPLPSKFHASLSTEQF